MQDNNNNIDNQFTDFAWGEMSKILDKEMPQKKRNRTVFFWLIGLALITSISLFYLNTNMQEEHKEMAGMSIGDGVITSNETAAVKIDKPTKKETNDSNLTVKNDAKINTKNNSNVDESAQRNTVNNLKTKKTPTQQSDKLISKVQEKPPVHISSNSTVAKKDVVQKQVLTNVNEVAPAQKDLSIEEQISDNENELLPVEKENILTEDETVISKNQDAKVESAQEIAKTEILENTLEQSEQVVSEKSEFLEETLVENVIEQPSTEENKVKVINKTNKMWALGIQSTVYTNKDFRNIQDWSSNIYLKRTLNRKFAISLGLGYTNVLYKNEDENGRSILGAQTSGQMEPAEDMSMMDGQNQGFPGITTLGFGENIRNHYLNVPLTAHYNINPRLSLSAGPGVEFLLNTSENDFSKKLNPFLHAGFNFHINDHLGIGLSYKFIGNRFVEEVNKDGAFDLSTPSAANGDPYIIDLVPLNDFKNLFGFRLDFTF